MIAAARVRMRFVAPLRPRTPSLPLAGDISFLPMEAIGDDGTYDRESVRSASEIAGAGYTYFEEGDVVRARVTPCFENGKGALLASLTGGRGLGTTELFVFRPSPRIVDRYLYYVTQSQEFTEHGAATLYGAHGVRRVDDQFARDYRVWLPPVSVQRSIADYLDRETARIDALVAAKRRLLELLEERWQGSLETRIRGLSETYGEIPLKYISREVVVGIVITPSAWYADSGVPAVRGVNVSPGAISMDEVVYLTDEGHRLHPKSRLRAGDVVVVRTGQAGTAAVVPAELDGVNCIDLVIIRTGDAYAPEFLEFVLNSDWLQKHIAEHSVGTIQSHFNVGAAAQIPVPRVPLAEQRPIAAQLRRDRGRTAELMSTVDRQVELLREHRQALITAAVTGELEIPVAA